MFLWVYNIDFILIYIYFTWKNWHIDTEAAFKSTNLILSVKCK